MTNDISGLEPQISPASSAGKRLFVVESDGPVALTGFEPELGGNRRTTIDPRLIARLLTATSRREREPVLEFVRERDETLLYARELVHIIPRNARRRIAGLWNMRYTQRQRMNAIAAVGDLGHAGPAIKPLFAALGDPDEAIRKTAISALSELWHIDDLWRLAQDSAHLRHHGARGLAERGDPRTIAALLVSLDDEDYMVRAAIANALGRLAAYHAIEDLVRLLKDTEWLVRRAAVEALGEIAASMEDDDPRLHEIEIVKPLISILLNGTWAERQAAAEALAQIGKAEQTLAPLTAALLDREALVRQAAAHALGMLGDTDAFEPLVDLLLDNNEPLPVRREIVRALGLLGDSRAVPLLITLLQRHPHLRPIAANALSALGGDQSTEMLIEVLQDDRQHYRVHQAAASALRDIGSQQARTALTEYEFAENSPD